jgi:hypothetical protein
VLDEHVPCPALAVFWLEWQVPEKPAIWWIPVRLLGVTRLAHYGLSRGSSLAMHWVNCMDSINLRRPSVVEELGVWFRSCLAAARKLVRPASQALAVSYA